MKQSNYITNRKKYKHILEKDRYTIEQMLKAKCELQKIAEVIGCSSKTIKREIVRGSWEKLNSDLTKTGIYSADVAQRKHDETAKNKGRYAKITNAPALRAYLENKLKREKYSPEATLFEIRNKSLKFELEISVKTVYNCVDSGEIGVKRADLPRKRSWRKKNAKLYKSQKNLRGTSIDERPQKANERVEFGHLEGDLVLSGKGKKSCLLTLTDRRGRREIIEKMPDKSQKSLKIALEKVKNRFPKLNFKTVTFDNGSEFLDSRMVKNALKCEVFYAHAYASWERGSNENANGIIRRFYPKGTDFGKVSVRELRQLEDWINNYPRKILGGLSANDYEKLAA